MRLLFKMVFYGFLGLLILPAISPVQVSDSASQPKTELSADVQQPNTTEDQSADIMRIALGVAGDVGSICGRQPELCQAGGRLAQAAMSRAKDGMIVLANMVEQHRAAQADSETTGSVE